MIPQAIRQKNPQAAAETEALLADLWQRHLPTLRERLDVLDSIAAKAVLNPLSAEDRDTAIAISHKFAGSLGMYGYRRGTEVAMAIEQLLRSLAPLQPDRLTPLAIELREAIFPKR